MTKVSLRRCNLIYSNKVWKTCFAILFFTLIQLPLVAVGSGPTTGQFSLEHTHEWQDAKANAYSICSADVDNDGVLEIITAGWVSNDLREGQLKICTWDQVSFMVEKEELFKINGMDTVAHGVAVSDLDKDGTPEIVLTGYAWDANHNFFGWLRVYHWDGTSLTALDTKTWSGSQATSLNVEVGDIDGDGTDEIITAGLAGEWESMSAHLCVWSWNTGLHLEESKKWSREGSTLSKCYDIGLGRLDGRIMIATVGYFELGDKTHAELRLWEYGSGLTLVASTDWESEGNTFVTGVLIENNRIYTVGMSHDGNYANAQLRIWRYGSLTLEASEEWRTIGNTLAYDVFVEDVDGDGEKEVLTVGWANDGERNRAQLRVWSYGSNLTLKDSKEWYKEDNTHPFSIYVADVDGDGVNEVLTSGNANDFKLCQITLWSYPDITNPVISELTPAEGAEVDTGKPEISASLSDDYSGIDAGSLLIKVDGLDVTSEATITETGVSYTPTTDLSEGKHNITVEVSDKSKNKATTSWSFNVKLPEVSPTPSPTPSPRCIIATATYGSELAEEVKFLREFRDDVVSSTFAGSQFLRAFNAWYYSFSPHVALFIAKHPMAKAVMKIVLY
ncbi:MAG: hypothetical protein DRO05_08080, partial [Thermoproteota archaeon]